MPDMPELSPEKAFLDWPNHHITVESPESGVVFTLCLDCGERGGPFSGDISSAVRKANIWTFNHNFDVYLAKEDEKAIKRMNFDA